MKRQLTIALTVVLMSLPLAAQTVRTTRHAPRPTSPETSGPVTTVCDTIIPTGDEVTFSRYDKPLRSSVETFFVTNNTGRRIVSAVVTTTYLDSDRRPIHRASRRIALDLGPGETRAVSHRSWDRQQSFYYVGSRRPRRAQATPFDVSLRADTIFCSPRDIPADGTSD